MAAMRPATNAIEASRREFATGRIRYREGGKVRTWSIACMAHESPESLRWHPHRWKPLAVFLSGRIIPDRKKNT